MTLTKKQQELLLYMLFQKGFRLDIKKQKIYNSSALFKMIDELIELNLITHFKKESDGCSYQLTDKGLFLICILNHGKKYPFKIEYILDFIY